MVALVEQCSAIRIMQECFEVTIMQLLHCRSINSPSKRLVSTYIESVNAQAARMLASFRGIHQLQSGRLCRRQDLNEVPTFRSLLARFIYTRI